MASDKTKERLLVPLLFLGMAMFYIGVSRGKGKPRVALTPLK